MEKVSFVISIIELIFIVVEGIFIAVQVKQGNKLQQRMHLMLQELYTIKK